MRKYIEYCKNLISEWKMTSEAPYDLVYIKILCEDIFGKHMSLSETISHVRQVINSAPEECHHYDFSCKQYLSHNNIHTLLNKSGRYNRDVFSIQALKTLIRNVRE